MNDAAPTEQAGHSAGLVRFFDKTYTQVGSDYSAAGNLRAPDIHELNTPIQEQGETMLVDIYEVRSMDLRPYLGVLDGYVLDACFQEVSLRTKAVLFQWCALDHMPIWDTYIYLHIPGTAGKNDSMPIAGNGTWDAPWDFFHINAVGKNLEGDYIVSGRHMDAVYKIAGLNNNLGIAPGEIIWNLGGKRNDFDMQDGFNFSRQHTVRFLSTGKTESTITLFNNAFDGWFYTSHYSTGQLISINNETMTARLVSEYSPPSGERSRSFSQGSMQVLDNGNVFMGWGNRAYVSEHSADGTPIYWAHFSGSVESFRAWKFPWKGYPTTKPKVVSYAYNGTKPLYAYVSWNGATEVAAWSLYYSESTRHGPWISAGTVVKDGFETRINFTELSQQRTNFYPYVYAEALDKNGEVLATSEVCETFVPNKDFKKECNETLCYKKDWYKYQSEDSEAEGIPRNHGVTIWVLALLFVALELVSLVWSDWGLDWLQDVRSGRRSWRSARRSRLGTRRRRVIRRISGSDDGEQSWDEKSFRPGTDRNPSGPAPLVVTVGGKTGTGFPMKASGFEV